MESLKIRLGGTFRHLLGTPKSAFNSDANEPELAQTLQVKGKPLRKAVPTSDTSHQIRVSASHLPFCLADYKCEASHSRPRFSNLSEQHTEHRRPLRK